MLDVDAGRVASGQAVRIEGGIIASVGAEEAVDCRGLAAIDGNGRTLMPGLWDMHVHIGIDDGPLHIAAGVTTVRDLANDHDDLMAAIEQFERGDAIGPGVHRAGFIDAKSPYSAPTGNLAGSLDDALGFIDTLDQQGYPQVKIYSSIPTDWVEPMAAEIHRPARRRGHHRRPDGVDLRQHVPPPLRRNQSGVRGVRRSAMTLKGNRLYRPAELYRALGIEPFVAAVEVPASARASNRAP